MPDSTPIRANAPLTTARVSLGITGTSIPTREHLRFQLDHALARDAVHAQLDTTTLLDGLRARSLQPMLLRSNAHDRTTYLHRPDLGRTLHPDSIASLQTATAPGAPVGVPGEPHLLAGVRRLDSVTLVGVTTKSSGSPVLFLLADGLSPLALERHALPLLDSTLPLLIAYPLPLIPVLTNARVALADHVGALLGAQLTVLLIGERPGLSSPDSLGVYITWNPRPGLTTDAHRNCISNIRGNEGLSYTEAAARIAHYVREATRLQTTGTTLKDPSSLSLPAS